MLSKTTDDGRTLFIDELRADAGTEGDFYLVYESVAGDDLWGYYCSNCNTFVEATGPIFKLVCSSCQNRRTPE